MPLPASPAVTEVGRLRLRALREAVRCPIGLENLALAFSRSDALAHGQMLDEMLDGDSDFVLLDLHNLWCQAVNFEIDPGDLLGTFPLDRVRELHLSGGSWTVLPDGGRFRRDTHDDALPEALFPLLEAAMTRCPNLELVVLERMGGTIAGREDQLQLARDFQRVRRLVRA